jgi:hypothetical protein
MKSVNGGGDADDAVQRQFAKDLARKSIACHLRSTRNQGKNPKVVGFFTSDVPTTRQGFADKSQLRFLFQVVTALEDGFCQAPLECKSNGKYVLGENPRALSTMKKFTPLPECSPADGHDATAQLFELECEPYTIIEGKPQWKGPTNPQHGWKVRAYSAWCVFFLPP